MTKINLGNIKIGNEVVEVTEDNISTTVDRSVSMPEYQEVIDRKSVV